MVIALGEKYGAIQAGSGLSATHEEYREARGKRPVIAFVQQGIDPAPDQAEFIKEVQAWEGGLFRGPFLDPAELQAGITRALHDYELANAIAPADPAALIIQAEALLPKNDRSTLSGNGPTLSLAVVGGPEQKILRPIQIEDRRLYDHLHQTGLFGDAKIFDGSKGVQGEIRDGILALKQERGTHLQIGEGGAMLLRLPLEDRASLTNRSFGGSTVIEEVVQEQLRTALAYVGTTLEHVDPTQRLTHVAIAAQIEGGGYFGWRTRAEHEASPNSGAVVIGSDPQPAITLHQPRPALRLNTSVIVEDLLVPLRRQWKSR